MECGCTDGEDGREVASARGLCSGRFEFLREGACQGGRFFCSGKKCAAWGVVPGR